jgi:hypothetical protein
MSAEGSPRSLLLAMTVFLGLTLWPSYLDKTGLVYAGVGSDDFCYLSHATALVYGQWPDYSREDICLGELPMASIGPGLLAAPFVLAFSVVDRVNGAPVVQRRTTDSVLLSWTAFGFVVSSVTWFSLACLILWRRMKLHTNASTATWAVVLFILCQGVPIYAVRRPVFAHASEMFCLALLLDSVLAMQRLEHFPRALVLRLGLASGFLGLCRYNDLPHAVLWPLLAVWPMRNLPGARERLVSLAKALGVALALWAVFKVVPTLAVGQEKYADAAADVLLKPVDPAFLLRRVFVVLFRTDWGLVFTAPFLLVAGVFLARLRFPQKRLVLALTATNLLNFYMVLNFGAQAGFYGYRYFLFGFLASMILPFALGLHAMRLTHPRASLLGMCLLAVPPVFSMLLFEGNSTDLAMNIIQQDTRLDWGHPNLQAAAWRHLVEQPRDTLVIMFKGVPAYSTFLFMRLLGLESLLPPALSSKFEPSGATLAIRVGIMMATPWLVAWAFHWRRRDSPVHAPG